MLKLVIILTLVVTACGEVKFESTVAKGSIACPDCPSALPRDPTDVSETFTTPSSNKVDILFVIDNSGSMEVEQGFISTRLSSFTSKIAGLDWRIAITSTDMTGSMTRESAPKDGWLVSMDANGTKFLTKETVGYETIFENKVKLGSSGSGNEQGINATLSAVERNQGDWMRDDAQFAAIVLSDEDECSAQNASCWSLRNDPTNLVAKVETLFASRKNFTFNSIVISDNVCLGKQGSQIDPDTLNPMPAAIGDAYIEASNATGGIVGSICSLDYGQELTAMGNLIDSYTNSYVLQCQPVGGLVTVRYSDGTVVPNHVSGSRVIFDNPVQAGSTLKLDYQCP